MNKIKLIIFIQLVFFSGINAEKAKQDKFNSLLSAIPSLTISPDARGGGMGNIGGATEADICSQHWNPAKYPFTHSKAGINFSFTPWMPKLADDIMLNYLCGYTKIGNDKNLAIGTSFRYFSLGKIDYPLNSANLYDLALDASVSLKFSENFAGAVALRYIYSDLIKHTKQSVTADIAGYYNNYLTLEDNEYILRLGFNISNISNIGNKISYDNGNSSIFLPINLRMGASLLYILDNSNTLSYNIDINKYLITTPHDSLNNKEACQAYYTFMKSILHSFSDHRDLKEKLKEIMWAFGIEYAYDKQFFIRSGFFYECPQKSKRQYFSLGTSFKLTTFQLDIAYLISLTSSNPLDRLQFSLNFNID